MSAWAFPSCGASLWASSSRSSTPSESRTCHPQSALTMEPGKSVAAAFLQQGYGKVNEQRTDSLFGQGGSDVIKCACDAQSALSTRELNAVCSLCWVHSAWLLDQWWHWLKRCKQCALCTTDRYYVSSCTRAHCLPGRFEWHD